MKSEELATDLRRPEPQDTAAPASLFARGSGARSEHSPWSLCQRGDRLFIRIPGGWLDTGQAGQTAGGQPTAATASMGSPVLADTIELPAGEAGGSLHGIVANPGKSDGCTSNSLHLGADGGFPARGVDRAVTELAGQYDIAQLVPCRGRIHALVQAQGLGSPAERRIFVATPETQPLWKEITGPENSSADRRRISHLVSFAETLYATVDDEHSGFELWRLDDTESSKPHWVPVIAQGGQGHSASARVTAVYADSEQLLLACAAGAELAAQDTPSVGPELIQVKADNSWDLIVGSSRLTPQGLAVPRSLMGRGFDNSLARQIASISRCGKQFSIALAVPAAAGEQLRGEVWTSDDLEAWSKAPLADEIKGLQATLVSALYNQGTTLLVIDRRSGPGSVEAQRVPAQHEVPGLPRDIEFWLQGRED